jgi:addiction module HigA family antidote
MLEQTPRPVHPGIILREEIFPSLQIDSQQAAKQLGIDHSYLEQVLLEEAPITADLALRLEAWLGEEHGGHAGLWLSEQATYDLWYARDKEIALIQPIFAPPPM